MKSSKPRRESLETLYRRRYEAALKPVAKALGVHVTECFKDQPRIDRITTRAKDVDSFLEKAKTRVNSRRKYTEPLDQIQDQLGARVITFFRSDVEQLDEIVKRYFRPIEFRDRFPDSEWEFGYFGRHYVLVLPADVVDVEIDQALVPPLFELQIKTLFQHAWSEADHDLGYKPGLLPLSSSEKRRLAYTSAQAWGADRTFDELFRERSAARLATEQ
jgi:putative GTP pyrophosphokinase